jgi:hypothetical protein
MAVAHDIDRWKAAKLERRVTRHSHGAAAVHAGLQAVHPGAHLAHCTRPQRQRSMLVLVAGSLAEPGCQLQHGTVASLGPALPLAGTGALTAAGCVGSCWEPWNQTSGLAGTTNCIQGSAKQPTARTAAPGAGDGAHDELRTRPCWPRAAAMPPARERCGRPPVHAAAL